MKWMHTGRGNSRRTTRISCRYTGQQQHDLIFSSTRINNGAIVVYSHHEEKFRVRSWIHYSNMDYVRICDTMTDCIHCHKIWSGNCKHCPGHIAEVAAFRYKADNYIHSMAQVIWGMPDGSLPSETETNMVSVHKPPLNPCMRQSRQGPPIQ